MGQDWRVKVEASWVAVGQEQEYSPEGHIDLMPVSPGLNYFNGSDLSEVC